MWCGPFSLLNVLGRFFGVVATIGRKKFEETIIFDAPSDLPALNHPVHGGSLTGTDLRQFPSDQPFVRRGVRRALAKQAVGAATSTSPVISSEAMAEGAIQVVVLVTQLCEILLLVQGIVYDFLDTVLFPLDLVEVGLQDTSICICSFPWICQQVLARVNFNRHGLILVK